MTKKIKTIGLLALLSTGLFGVGLLTETVSANVEPRAEETVYFKSDEAMEIEYGALSTNRTKGVSISLNGVLGKQKATIEYLNYISTDTLEDGFLSLGMMPSRVGDALDFDYLSVSLTDAMDESQQIVWTVASPSSLDPTWPNFITSWVTLTERFETCYSENWGNHKQLRFEESGQYVYSRNSFVAPVNPAYTGPYNDTGYNFSPQQKNKVFIQETKGAPLQEIKFSFAENEPRINDGWVAKFQDVDFYTRNTEKLDDSETLSRYTKEHTQNLFSSGYVKLKISYLGLNVDKVTLHIDQIGTQTLSKNEDCKLIGESPFMSANIKGNAVVGYDYEMPRMTALDMIDGNMSAQVACAVKKNGATMHSGYNPYTFTEAGNYEIVYTVTNGRGQTFVKEYPIECFDDVPHTSYGSVLGYKDSYYIGEAVLIPAVDLYNDLSLKEDKSVVGDVVVQCNGQVIDRFNTTETVNYTLSNAGNYAVILSYLNDFGVIHSKVYKFTVQRGLAITPDLIPVSFTAGKANPLYDMTVFNSLNDNGYADIYRTLLINGTKVYEAKGDDVLFGSLVLEANALSEAGTATLTYAAGFASGEYVATLDYELPVIKPKYVGDYVIASNADNVRLTTGYEVEYYESEAVFKTEEDLTFTLPNLLVASELSLSFDVKQDSKIESLQVVLTDAKYTDKQMVFKLTPGSTTASVLRINGESVAVDGSFINDEKYFNLVWNDRKNLLCDEQGDALVSEITKWSDGSPFGGFSDGLVKVSFQLNGVGSGGARFSIKQVCNSSFGSDIFSGKVNALFDIYAPIINLSSDMQTQRVGLGERLTIVEATAYDVFDSSTSISVSVRDPNGKYVLENVPCEEVQNIIISSYGVWTVTYSASDSTGLIQASKTFTYKITDDVEPLITIKGELASRYKVGEKITIPKAIAWDNHSKNLEVDIFVVLPSGRRIACEGYTYTFTEVGEYRILYYVHDEAYNFTQIQFDILVV